MSYAIAPTFEGTRLGIRRLGVLSGICGEVSTLGDTAGTVDTLVSLGMLDRGTANYLVSKGATDYQLIALLNGQTDLVTLMNQLQGTLAPYNPASPANPVMNATISTPFGLYDLTQQAAWDSINSLFVATQQKLTDLARRLPNDPQVIGWITEFNSKVAQWAGYYSQAFGSTPSPMPTVTLSGLGIAPLLVGGAVAVAAIGALVYYLYTRNRDIDAKNAATAVSATALSQAQAAIAAGNPTLASQILAAAGGSAGGTSSVSSWVTANWPLLIAGAFGFLLVGIVTEKKL